jgi:glucosyl-dolichyl phosphate glucuronosyltransferase
MLSIIIPTLNRADVLELAIRSFCQQKFPVDNFEIIVVDNASTDRTADVAEQLMCEFPLHQLRYVYEPVPGLLSGRHRGALEARGEILTFVDDDIEADPHWLQAIQSSFDDSDVQLVGGRNLPKYEAEPPEWLDWFWEDHPYGKSFGSLSLLDFGDQVREIDANYVWGLNFSIRKSALLELGGFHPDCVPSHVQHFQGDGESGLTQKANSRGFKAIYQPEALVYHSVSKDRMTYTYFDKRYFYQGVCDSYSKIRADQKFQTVDQIKISWRDLKQGFSLRVLSQRIRKAIYPPSDRDALRKRFYQAHQQGYQFHQNAVRQCPELCDWILKSDYWDYELPHLKINHG